MRKRLIAAAVAAIYWRPSPPTVAGPGLTAADVAKAAAKLGAARVPITGRVLWLEGIEYRT